MKIITPGNVVAPQTWRAACGCCGCVFEFADADIREDSVEIPLIGHAKRKVTVVCPQHGCHRFVRIEIPAPTAP